MSTFASPLSKVFSQDDGMQQCHRNEHKSNWAQSVSYLKMYKDSCFFYLTTLTFFYFIKVSTYVVNYEALVHFGSLYWETQLTLMPIYPIRLVCMRYV